MTRNHTLLSHLRLHQNEVKIEVTLRLTVGQSVYLSVGHPLQAHDQILLFPFFCREIALLFVLGRPL
jgi:hypothetical protein